MRLFALRQTLSQRWRAMRQALRKQLWRQQQQQVRGKLPITGLHIGVSAGVSVALAYFLGDRLLTPGRFVALFRGVDDMLRAGSSLGHSSRELQNQSAEISYVREFLDLPEDDGTWLQQPPADRTNQPSPSPNRCARDLPSKTSGSPIQQPTPLSPAVPVPSYRASACTSNPENE